MFLWLVVAEVFRGFKNLGIEIPTLVRLAATVFLRPVAKIQRLGWGARS